MCAVQRSGPAGAGLLYVRLSLRTLSTALPAAPVARGFSLARAYEAKGDAGAGFSVDAAPAGGGGPARVWRVPAGAQGWVVLTLTAPAPREFVALVDRLPAGLEFVRPRAGAALRECAEHAVEGPYGSELAEVVRNQDVLSVFWSSMAPGVHRVRVLVAAVVPGLFVAPQASVEQMYAPETYAHTTADIFVVS